MLLQPNDHILFYGDSITVNGASYQVRETLLLDDGQFCQIALTKQ